MSSNGRFGLYGGRYVPETLAPALIELECAWERLHADTAFNAQLSGLLRTYVGRPTPLYRAHRLAEAAGAGHVSIYLKREDLCHTGSHKLNNALGQALLARALGKTRLIAETGAGQHGVAIATAAALVGLPCHVYMGEEDVRRQALNVQRMELLGAEVTTVHSGSRTLKDATNEAIRDWMTSYRDTHYAIGSVVGPHPYPSMVRTFQSVIGREARAQVLECEGRLPDALVACVGGGSNAIGLFQAFLDDDVAMIGVEAMNAASLGSGTPGVLHGAHSMLLQDADGQVMTAHSIAAGLDYPGVGPEHAWLQDNGRARYESVSDAETCAAFALLSRSEGIIPALESAHAIAHAITLARTLNPDSVMVICLSGRGDKDLGRST